MDVIFANVSVTIQSDGSITIDENDWRRRLLLLACGQVAGQQRAGGLPGELKLKGVASTTRAKPWVWVDESIRGARGQGTFC